VPIPKNYEATKKNLCQTWLKLHATRDHTLVIVDETLAPLSD
jgi:hypothetical protein